MTVIKRFWSNEGKKVLNRLPKMKFKKNELSEIQNL